METITSSKNASYKLLRDLKKRAVRESLRLTFIEGTRFVEEAIAVRWPLEAVFVSQSFSKGAAWQAMEAEVRRIGVVPVILTDSLFESASDTKTPQGVLAIIRFPEHHLDDLFFRAGLNRQADAVVSADLVRPADAVTPVDSVSEALGNANRCRIVLLDGIQDPGNAGTIIRTAEAAGFSGVVFSDGCVDLCSPKTLRATMGSVFRVPVVVQARLPEVIDRLKGRSVTVNGAVLKTEENCYDHDLSKDDFALVIGSEAFGIREEVLACCDRLIRIPMQGGAESLNAGVAASVLMFEALRQKRHRKS